MGSAECCAVPVSYVYVYVYVYETSALQNNDASGYAYEYSH